MIRRFSSRRQTLLSAFLTDSLKNFDDLFGQIPVTLENQ